MLQKEIPTTMRLFATASSSSSVYQKIERFSSTIACVKTTELLLKVWIMSQTTTETWSSFFGQKKGKEMKLFAKGVDGWWAAAITPFDFADIAPVDSIFPRDFSKQQSSVLSLPSFLPSFSPSFPALHCTAEGRIRPQTPLSPSIYHIHRVPDRYPPGITWNYYYYYYY